MKYSCIICAYNEGHKLADTVASIEKTIKSSQRNDVEIIVIDDASTDGSMPESLSSDITSVCVNQGNKGISYSRNKGIQNAAGEYVIFLDAHILIAEGVDFFGELDIALDSGRIAGVSGIYQTRDKHKDKNRIRDIVRELYRKKTEPAFIISNRYFTTISSCVFCIKKDVISQYMFNNEFKGVAAEDTMLQLQLHKDGFLIMHNPKVRIIHDADLGYWGLLSKIVYQANGTHRLLAKAVKGGYDIPCSTFFLDFPIWTFGAFWIGGALCLFDVFSLSGYIAALLVALVLDFFPLVKLLKHNSSLMEKWQVALYVFMNEGIKIFAWPVSIITYKYTFSELARLLKIYARLYREKVKQHISM